MPSAIGFASFLAANLMVALDPKAAESRRQVFAMKSLIAAIVVLASSQWVLEVKRRAKRCGQDHDRPAG